jgi:plasmid stabilization system protein ParE
MVNKMKFTIIWSPDARADFKEILEWYGAKSKPARTLVKEAIFDTILKIQKQPFIFEKDKFKSPQEDSYRAFTIYSTRITIEIVSDEIHILRLRHTSREPLEY